MICHEPNRTIQFKTARITIHDAFNPYTSKFIGYAIYHRFKNKIIGTLVKDIEKDFQRIHTMHISKLREDTKCD